MVQRPNLVGQLVYFGSDDGNLYALDASSERQMWSFPTDNAVSSSPTVVNGIVYVSSTDGKLYAVFA
jgi:outer membrane protein assembly factor BamB